MIGRFMRTTGADAGRRRQPAGGRGEQRSNPRGKQAAPAKTGHGRATPHHCGRGRASGGPTYRSTRPTEFHRTPNPPEGVGWQRARKRRNGARGVQFRHSRACHGVVIWTVQALARVPRLSICPNWVPARVPRLCEPYSSQPGQYFRIPLASPTAGGLLRYRPLWRCRLPRHAGVLPVCATQPGADGSCRSKSKGRRSCKVLFLGMHVKKGGGEGGVSSFLRSSRFVFRALRFHTTCR